ncbi:unnamed protein product [Camellia sinensis]
MDEEQGIIEDSGCKDGRYLREPDNNVEEDQFLRTFIFGIFAGLSCMSSVCYRRCVRPGNFFLGDRYNIRSGDAYC